ncbi:MAG: hypothetical protein E7540_00900 [Ruminococcaceae bacterium]|nr:hypothetical protein [Oscillospiraceae bacterium]
MIKNKLLRRIALALSLIILLTSAVNTTLGFIVTKTDSLINTFIPFESIINNLIINKTVEHSLGDGYVIPENISFDFKVELGSLYANTTIKTTKEDMVADPNGSLVVSVKPGETFALKGIDTGTKVTVTEIQKTDSGFNVKDDAVTVNGIVCEDGSLEFDYINVYTPQSVKPTNIFVSGEKILEGRDWQEGDTFSFALEQKNSDGVFEVIDTKTVEYNANNSTFNHFDFSDLIHSLSFKKVGVYSFRMTEVAGNLENVHYDKSVNYFSVRVSDTDMDGKLEIGSVTASQNATVREENGGFSIFVTFNNTFVPVIPSEEEIEVKIEVDKEVKNTGDNTLSPKGFEFVLENTQSFEKLSLKTDENGSAVFCLPFTCADVGKVYSYRLFEINGGLKDVIYDQKEYSITVTIDISDEGNLVYAVALDGNITDNATAKFINTYNSDKTNPPPTGDNSNVWFWFVVMIISLTVCIVLIFLPRKNKK